MRWFLRDTSMLVCGVGVKGATSDTAGRKRQTLEKRCREKLILLLESSAPPSLDIKSPGSPAVTPGLTLAVPSRFTNCQCESSYLTGFPECETLAHEASQGLQPQDYLVWVSTVIIM